MVTGYSEFVNGGKKISASLIDRIQDRNGKTIWRHDARKCDGCNDGDWHGQEEPLLADTREQIIDPRTAYQIVSMLRGRGAARHRPVRSARSRQAAGRQDRHLERTPRTSGSSASRPISSAASMSASTIRAPWVAMEQGATVAAPIFRDFMKDALGCAADARSASRRASRKSSVDWKSGAPVEPARPAPIMEAFKAGTAPGEANAPGAECGGNGAGRIHGPPQLPRPRARLGEPSTGGLY